jgi:hypothetical protein
MARGPSIESGNGLDRLLQRFQHRWETDRQWRAAMGGAIALFTLVALCGTVAGVGAAATRVLGPAGLGLVDLGQPAGDSGTPNTGAKLVNGVLTFPTPTAVWTVGAVPAVSPIANSSTPIPNLTPTPTDTPTPTPSPSPTSGGGGGGGNCSGSGNGITYTLSPCPQVHGTTGTITVSAPGFPGHGIRILLILNQSGTCTHNDCGFDWTNLALDGNGVVSQSYTIAADAVNSAPIGGSINISGGNQTNILVTTPVQ